MKSPEKVKLKVTYHDAVPINGKEYATTLTLNVKPVKKYSVKQSGKAEMCSTFSGNRKDSTVVSFTATPDVMKGINLSVTDLKGGAAPKEAEFGPIKWCNDHYEVTVKANENTYKLKKQLQFGIAIKDENGLNVSGSKITPMKVSLFSMEGAQIQLGKRDIMISADKFNKTNCENHSVITIPLKLNQKKAVWKVVSTESDIFTCRNSEVDKDAKLYLYVSDQKIKYITCNHTYRVPITFEESYTGKRVSDTITVTITDPKTIKIDVLETSYDMEKKQELVLHRNAPYLEDYFYIGTNSFTKPYRGAGLGNIEKVEIVGAANELYQVNCNIVGAADCKEYYIFYKGKKAPAKKGLSKITMKVSFSGTKKTKNITVKMRDEK
ncbi:MAG: hypothetical protein GX567_05845 [Clostridia bacterium]|nr:hypothetical protein [Clostridia bacterium]